MKKLLSLIALMLAAVILPTETRADWKGFSLPDYSTGLHAAPLGGREFINGQWVAGYGIDALYYQIPGSLNGKPLPKLYLALNHEWNAAELVQQPSKAVGLWGPAIGVSVGGFASKLQGLLNMGINLLHDTGGPVVQAPAWIVNDLDKWVTIEGGCGNRILGHLNDVKPWGCTVGGRVSVLFDVNTHH